MPAKIRFLNAAAAVAVLSAAACARDDVGNPDPQQIEEAQRAAALLGGRLKERLINAMQTGGPESAVDVCSKEASAIAAAVSQETGYDVGRTALRVRNRENAPDAWERDQLERFQAAISAGSDPAALEASKIVRTGDALTFRWARPIMTESLCTTCHGANVSPSLLHVIRKAYPDDAATGFSAGDLRGIFTVQKSLSDEALQNQ